MNATDTNKAFEAINDSIAQFTAPLKQMSEIALQNAEKLTAAHLDSYGKYAAIGLDNAKAAMQVNDPKSMQDFAQNQRDVLKQVTDQLATDAKTIAELSSTFMTAAQKTSQSTIKKAAKKAA